MDPDEDFPAGTQLEASLDPSEPLAAESSQRLRALYDIGRLLLAARAPLEILRSIQAAIVEHLQPEHTCVLAVDRDGSSHGVIAHNLDLTPPREQWDLGTGTYLASLRRAQMNGQDVKDELKAAGGAFGAGIEFVSGKTAFLRRRPLCAWPDQHLEHHRRPETEARNRGFQIRADVTFRVGGS